MSLVSFTTPLASGASVSSGALTVPRALNITGSVFADVPGTCYVDQGGDGSHWDYTTTIPVTGGTGISINVAVVDQYFQVRYTNGGTGQAVFRLFADARDPYGAFLQPAQAPSAGGAFAVLLWNPNASTYRYVGRFDGLDAFNACSNAAVSLGQSGKYAAFQVSSATVTTVTVTQTGQLAPDAF